MIAENAPAKINLALHVTGQRADGYHLLDSLVVFAGYGDVLHFSPARSLDLSVRGVFAKGVPTDDSNLALKAAALFGIEKGAAISLEKRLPHAAGIGGGSADAAATLRGLARLWQTDLPNAQDILTLGADVPVCLTFKPQRMTGIGENLSEIPPLPVLHIVLINPRLAVPTGPVFAGLLRKDNPPMEHPNWQGFDSFIAWLSRQRNDLEPPALAIAPAISLVLSALSDKNAALARMSGSGATCFGVFETADAAQKAAASIQATHPDWWIKATEVLRGC